MADAGGQFVERDYQLDYLDSLFGECIEGRGGAVVVTGPVASGKTELLNRFCDRVEGTDAIVLTAIGSRAEQAIPLGVVDQLLRGHYADGLPAPIVALLERGTRVRWPDSLSQPACEAGWALHGLRNALLECARDAPLLIAVDDIHDADLPARLCLSSLMRRLRKLPVLVVLTEADGPRLRHVAADGDLLSHPHRRLQVPLLTRCGVSKLLEAHQLPSELVDEYHRPTGGNPLLVRALIEDFRSSPRARLGDAFAEAVLYCLHRGDPTTADVARALAVAGGPLPPATVARLLDLDIDTVDRAVRQLTGAGLLHGDWFRHRRIADTVAASAPPQLSNALHGQIAELKHSAGEPAAAVARHLVRASGVDGSWVVPTLQAAAEHALSGGEPDRAWALLEAARLAEPVGPQGAQVAAALLRATLRTSPPDALEYLPEVVAATRAGELAGRPAVLAVEDLLWFGRVDEAVDMLDTLGTVEAFGTEIAHDLCCALSWLAWAYPEYAGTARRRLARAVHDRPATAPELPVPALDGLRAELAQGIDDATAVEYALQQVRLADGAPFAVAAVLGELLFAGRFGAAAAAGDMLLAELAEASAMNLARCRALVDGARAEVAFHQGDPAAAEAHAVSALAAVPARGLGVFAGGVLATAVLATVSTGRYAAAARYLALPLPDGLFRTPFGPRYLHARGLCELATNRIWRAVSDFQECGDTMASLGLDTPVLAPWRSSLAEAYLALGQRKRGRELAFQQLSQLGDGQSRLRGRTLRVLAVASAPAERVVLLREAAELLRAADDRLESAMAYADLSDALAEVGEPDRARRAQRTARRLARQSQLEPLLRRLSAHPEPATGEPVPARPSGDLERHDELSEAELRVAELAVHGHTNREIASRLYVTVSTVEQHLTRVYRKLHVTRRAELRPRLLSALPTGE